jgi:hypothetical protein
MAEPPSMAAVLENVDKALNEQPSPEVAKFAPAKYRGVSSSASLSVIHTDIRNKTINSLDDDIRRVEEHLTQLKAVRDELKRIIG